VGKGVGRWSPDGQYRIRLESDRATRATNSARTLNDPTVEHQYKWSLQEIDWVI
jgi:hypothetical protein